jgi:protein SCO1
MKFGSKPLMLALVLVAAGAFATAVTLLVTRPAPRTLPWGPAVVGKTITTGTATIGGPFKLVSTNGETISDQSYRGKWLLIFFGYTFCPDVCPTSLNDMSVALEKLGTEANDIQPLFITVDPQRDTPEVMREYLKSFDSRIVGLTGTQEQIDDVMKEYRVYAEAQKTAGDENYLVSHSAYLYLMDPRGTFVNVIQGTASGEEIAAWVRKEMAQWN